MSRTSARHRKQSRFFVVASFFGYSRPRRQPPRFSAVLQRWPARLAAVAGITVIAGALAAAHWPAQARHEGSTQQDVLAVRQVAAQAGPLDRPFSDGVRLRFHPWTEHAARPERNDRRVNSTIVHTRRPWHKRSHVVAKPASPAVYRNPFRSLRGLIPERVDMGVDFGGTGPIYALGNGVVTNASGDNPGWPGYGWITYQLTSGPAAGLMVYVAEDVRPAIGVGQKVTSSTVIASMFNGGAGIETGWAMPNGASAESQLPVAGGIGGAGPFPTRVGVNFDQLLQALGVPAASNADQSPFGLLPAGYPANWANLGRRP